MTERGRRGDWALPCLSLTGVFTAVGIMAFGAARPTCVRLTKAERPAGVAPVGGKVVSLLPAAPVTTGTVRPPVVAERPVAFIAPASLPPPPVVTEQSPVRSAKPAVVKRKFRKPSVRRSAEQVVAELADMPEIGLQTFALNPLEFTNRVTSPHPALELFDSRPDLGTLPLARGADCELDKQRARIFSRDSTRLRQALAAYVGVAPFVVPVDRNATALITSPPDVVASAAVARPDLLVLMTGGENAAVRQVVIEALARANGTAATQTLARRAIFDPEPKLRQQAARALKSRPAADARPLLLGALQYPWPAAADNAADTLVAMRDADAVPDLVRLLDGPDPKRYDSADGTPLVREIVRINHVRSCQLCHAPSLDSRDTLIAPVPSWERPPPPSFSTGTTGSNYYSRNPGPRPAPSPASPGLVRADLTYLRPDFSAVLPVENPSPWPKVQRFDFVVRTRAARPGEMAGSVDDWPQRDAVLRALRDLTGDDFGDRAEDWRNGLAADARFAGLPAANPAARGE